LLAAALLMAWPLAASAKTWRVPRDYPTIQGAIDAASAGDEIEVGKGRHCGATLTKPLTLTASPGKHDRGDVTIMGCAGSPVVAGVLRVGFFLPGTPGAGPASGSKIRGFTFDGRGVSSSNLSPLAFGIFARFSDHIVVEDNEFRGTVQAITNTAGDHWTISDNDVEDLTLFDCTVSAGLCGGGIGIAIQAASAAIGAPGGAANPLNRPEATAVVDNEVKGRAPSGFSVFGMNGILVFAADGTYVVDNETKITPGINGSDPLGIGILVTNSCCGDPTELLPGARYTALIKNQDRSQFGVVVEGTGGVNTQGLVLFGNSCSRVLIDGAPPARAAARAAAPVVQRTRFE
jgi:hypothetical protein